MHSSGRKQKLTSDAIITRDMITKAGQAILFDKNFTINQGIALEAIIEECAN